MTTFLLNILMLIAGCVFVLVAVFNLVVRQPERTKLTPTALIRISEKGQATTYTFFAEDGREIGAVTTTRPSGFPAMNQLK